MTVAADPPAPPRSEHKASPSLLYGVKQVELAVRSHLDEILKASRVTTLQYTALTVLRRRDGLTAAQLARNSFVTTQSMADLVSALERQNFVVRRKDPQDGRRALISLTAQGEELLGQHEAAVRALEERMLSNLTPAQIRNLRTALNECREALADEPPH